MTGTAFVVASTFSFNWAVGSNGGAVYGQPVISQSSVFVYNNATWGGGIYSFTPNANIINSTVSYNVATSGKGGGAYCMGNLKLTVRDAFTLLTRDRSHKYHDFSFLL